MNSITDEVYMKKHLAEYILFQVDQGYALEDIKSALMRYGYKKSLVRDLLAHLDILPQAKPKMYNAEDLDKELKIYVQSLLIDYIVKEHKVGYSLDAIKAALINFGHDPRSIDEAIAIIQEGKVVDYRAESKPFQFPHYMVTSLTAFLTFAFLVFLSVSTDTSILTVLPHFSPSLVTLAIVALLFQYVPNKKLAAALPLLAVGLTVGLFIAALSYGIMDNAPGADTLLMLNAVVAFLSVGVIAGFSKIEKEEVIVKVEDPKEKEKNEAEQEMIEAKIQTPSLEQEAPKEPYHPKRQRPRTHPNTYNKEHSMLRYLRDEIDQPKHKKKASHRKPTKAVYHLPQKHEKKERLKIKEI